MRLYVATLETQYSICSRLERGREKNPGHWFVLHGLSVGHIVSPLTYEPSRGKLVAILATPTAMLNRTDGRKEPPKLYS
jgi:hypothetical protein